MWIIAQSAISIRGTFVMRFRNKLGLVAALGALLITSAAMADTYTSASFSGSINAGGANVKAPFSGNGFTQSDPFSGSIVFDNQLVPASGTLNVLFSSFPDIGLIPNMSAFSITFDGLNFNLGDNLNSLLSAGIQYKNGVFNGFEFITDFAFQGNEYQFRIDGPVITVRLLDGTPNAFDPNGFPTGVSLINAKVNVLAGLTDEAAFIPGIPEVPLPAALPLFATGLGVLGLLGWRRKRKGAAVAA
jgi:hypothetical protein